MRSELFWLLSFCGFAAMALVCGLLAWPQLSAAWPSIEERIARFRRQPPLAKVVLLVFVVGFIAYGSTKTNQVDGVGLGLRSRSTMEDNVLCMTSDYDFPHPSVTPADIARGWQLWEVRTNHDVCYTMPEGATMATNWWVRGAYEDVKKVEMVESVERGEWRFPFGSNEWDSAWALTWGRLRFALADTNTEIAAVGAPMSAVPYRSRLWSAADTNGSRLVTWENFALNRDTDTPVNAQIELRASGDFVTRSNEVETVYRRIDQEDWDDDGWRNDDDPDPYVWEEYWDSFWQELPEGANSNVYYWVDIRPRWNSYIEFYGDGPSDLEDPYIYAKAGETYRVQLLIGKTYDVESDQPFDIVARSDGRVEVSNVEPNSCTVVWPVTLTVAEGRAPTGRPRLGATWNDGGSTFHVLPDPPWLNGRIVWDTYCCALQGDGTNFTFACDNNCTCEGCTASGNYIYAGYALPFWSWPCGCGHVDDQGDPGVAIDFDKSAIIYEDPYENLPGELVTPPRPNAVLRCSVAGGTYGGTLSVTLNGAAQQKLRKVWGDELPNNLAIAPGAVRFFVTEYEILEPSDDMNDIIAMAEFLEDFRNVPHSDNASMTAVKVELEAVDEAQGNPCMNRHMYGVHEWVKYRRCPTDINLDLTIVGAEQDLVSSSERFFCPWTGGTYWLRFQILGETYETDIDVYEPEVVCREVWWNQIGVYGQSGLLDMRLALYIEPTFVSFKDLNMEEIPDDEACPHSGYFSTGDVAKTGALSHSRAARAGVWSAVRYDASWVADKASRETPYPQPWSDGVKEWRIPVGWGDYNGNIKGQIVPNPTTQLFTIDSSGMATIRKYNHEIRRAINNDVWLDGVLQED